MTNATERALLFTDIEGSTKLVEQLGDAAALDLWQRHDRAARDLLARHQGREIDRSDGFFLLFDHVLDAADFALGYHAALAALELKARIGLHVGPVLMRENLAADVARGAKPMEVEGLAKPFAARLMALAQGGQTLLSSSARAALRDDAALTKARIESHGHYRLKGVGEPAEVFELGVREGCAFAPPADTEKAYRVVREVEQGIGLWRPLREVRHNLPPERDAFVGRADDLATLAQRLDGGARLLTVLGPAGMGKTRLVRRYGLAWLGDWPGGVYFCDLSEARSLDGLHFGVAVSLGVPLGKDDPSVQLGHAIAGRGRCLLILDNFEQLVEHAAATLGRWFDRAAAASFLITSRQRLQMQGEEVLAIEPLPLQNDAVALFEVRALAQRADFTLDAQGRDAVAEVVRLLDGMPLAIELAAARVRVLSPAQIAQRMHDRFKLLTGAKGATARQATLRAAIDWSWELLEPWEQSAMAQCSVFEGGFTLEAAEATLDLAGWPEAPTVMDTVQALVDKSLVRIWARAEQNRFDVDEPYFGMYLSIHEYAAGKLGAAGAHATRDAQQRHGLHFARFGSDEAIRSLSTFGGVKRHRALVLEIDNLVAACRRAVARGECGIAVANLGAAWQVFEHRGPLLAAIGLGELVLAMPSASRQQRMSALITQSLATRLAGRFGEAQACLDRALTEAEQLGDPSAVGVVQRRLGLHCYEQGRIAEASTYYQAALVNTEGDRDALGSLYMDLGSLCADEGRPAEALQHYERSLVLRREIGDRGGEGAVLTNLASLHCELGHLVEGEANLHAALSIHRETGNRRSEGITLSNLGELRHEQGLEEEAAQYFEQGIALHRAMGNRRHEAISMGSLGVVRHWQGRLDEARRLQEQALAIHRQVGNRLFECYALGTLSTLHTHEGRFEEAQLCSSEALVIARALRSRLLEGLTLVGQAELLTAQGRAAESRPLLRDAEAILRPLGNELELAKLLCLRGRVDCISGDAAAATRTLAEANVLAERTGAKPASELGQAIARLRATLA